MVASEPRRDRHDETQPARARTAAQFGRQADAYLHSHGHAHGSDLDLLVEILRPDITMRVLDIATGAGHTAAAVAPLVDSVVAADMHRIVRA